MAFRNNGIGIWTARAIACLSLAFVCCMLLACGHDGRRFAKHHILVKDGRPLPPVAMTLPELDTPCNLLRTTSDSTSVAWLRPVVRLKGYMPEGVALFHIYTVSKRYYFTIYYPRPGGLYSNDSSFTAYMYRTRTTPDTIVMTSSSVPYYYVRATHRWYFNNRMERLPQVPALKETNRYIAHYINTAKQTDTNTLVRFGDVLMHRIYHYGSEWYMADYTTAGADIRLMRKSPHPLGDRFDYANLDDQRVIFNLTKRPFISNNKLSAEEAFRHHMHYFVVGQDGMVYRFNLGTNTPEDTISPKKEWEYNYSYYDSIFYHGPAWVDSVYRL